MAGLNFRTLDLNLLRVFNEVMTERSLTKAARKLALTQPAVSNALRRLREALDDELLRRSGQGLEPTPRALALWPAVQQALRQLQEMSRWSACRRARQTLDPSAGHATVGMRRRCPMPSSAFARMGQQAGWAWCSSMRCTTPPCTRRV